MQRVPAQIAGQIVDDPTASPFYRPFAKFAAGVPESERAVTRASYHYYRALLQGAPDATRQRLRRLWLGELQRRWPDALR